MKSIKLALFATIALVSTSFAQQKTVLKAVISTPAAQCDPCKDKIEAYMSREDGVTSVNVDIKKHTTTIVYITDRTNIENLKTALNNLGFDADDETAEDDAVKRLPKCCQKQPAPANFPKKDSL